MTEQTIQEGKTLAIVSYIPIFGTLTSFFLNRDKKNSFAAFHVRQALGLWGSYFLLGILVSGYDSWNVRYAFWIFFGVLFLYGVFTAFIGKAQPIPLLGDFFQKIFTSLGR
jgi:uncharacterized membrane protein